MSMRTLIVEDEPAAARRLAQMLQQAAPESEVLDRIDAVADAIAWLQTHPAPDLILLDIQLSDGLSFQIFEQVKVNAPVIFTTGYDEYALEAFQVNSIDYLLKPIQPEALREALDKLQRWRVQAPAIESGGLNSQAVQAMMRHLQTASPAQTYKERFLSRIGDKIVSIPVNKAVYFHSEQRTTYLYTPARERHIIDYTLDQLESQLDPQHFFRANRRLILHLDTVQAAHHSFNGKLRLDLRPAPPEEEVYVSREKAGRFKEWLEGE